MEIFNIQGNLALDKDKKTILFIDKGDQEAYTNTYGTARFIRDYVKGQYNVVTAGTSCGLPNNYYAFNGGFSDGLHRKKDNKNAHQDNIRLVRESFERAFKDLTDIEYIVIGTDFGFRLPSRPYFPKAINEDLHNLKHEYFDYVGDDQKIIDQIDTYNQQFSEDIYKEVSPLAFSTKVSLYFNELVLYLYESGKLKGDVIAFIIDPAFSSFIFTKRGINTKLCYFADDTRGTRTFMKFPISEFQHLLYDKTYISDSLDDWDDADGEKQNNLFFGGTIFHDTGFRSTVWPTFLRDIKSEKCTYFIPTVRNNFTKSTKKHVDYLNQNKQEMFEEVTNHPNYHHGLAPLELYKKIENYKYGIVFRCVSHYDSLNFKPTFYVSKDILPLLDEQYDPDFLQIPEHLQKYLVVRNSQDIDNKIKMFNDDENLRLSVLNELKKLFRTDEFLNQNDDIIKSEINKIIRID